MCFQSSAARKNRLNACSKISACSWRLTKIASKVAYTSARLPISIACSALSASITAPGPTGIPAARSARAKPTTLSAICPVGGLRWSMSVMVQPVTPGRAARGLIVARRFLQNLLQRIALHARDIVLVFQQRAQRVADQLRRQRAGVEFGQRGG